MLPTAWKKLVSCGTSSDFISAINLDRQNVFQLPLPLFTEGRAKVKYGTPYRKGRKNTGRRFSISKIDILGIVIWHLKSTSKQKSYYPIFVQVSTYVNVWLNFRMDLFYNVAGKKDVPVLGSLWPGNDEIKNQVNLYSVTVLMVNKRVECSLFLRVEVCNAQMMLNRTFRTPNMKSIRKTLK